MTRAGKYLPLFFFVVIAIIGLFAPSLFVSKASRDAVLHEASGANIPTDTTLNSLTSSVFFMAQDASTQASVKDKYGKLPMSFERNMGQTDDAVKFFSHGRGYNLFLTPAEAVFVLSDSSREATSKTERAEHTQRGRERRRQNAAVLRVLCFSYSLLRSRSPLKAR